MFVLNKIMFLPQSYECKKRSRSHIRATMKYVSSEVAKIGHTVSNALKHLIAVLKKAVTYLQRVYNRHGR